MNRRGFVAAAVGFFGAAALRLRATIRREETAIHAHGPDATEFASGRGYPLFRGCIPLEPREETQERMARDLELIKGCFAKYRHYGPAPEPSWLAEDIAEGLKRS